MIWTLVGVVSLLIVLAGMADAWLSGPRLEVVRPGRDGLQVLVLVAALSALIVLVGLPLAAGWTFVVGLVGLVAGYAATVAGGFTTDTGSAVVLRWRGLLELGGLSGILVILGTLWLGDGLAEWGVAGMLVATSASTGRYFMLVRAATAAEAVLVAEALALGDRACRSCGARLEPHSLVCGSCHEDFGGFCGFCGAPIEHGACEECGREQESGAGTAEPFAQRTCIACGAPIAMTDRHCPMCSLEQPSPCPICATPLLADDDVCFQCGFAATGLDPEAVRKVVSLL